MELANVLVGYADDSTLVAHMPHPSLRVAVVGSLNRDLRVLLIGVIGGAWRSTLQKLRRYLSRVLEQNTLNFRVYALTVLLLKLRVS